MRYAIIGLVLLSFSCTSNNRLQRKLSAYETEPHSVTSINLRRCGLDSIPVSALRQYPGLRELDLSHNNISRFPGNLTALSGLTVLNLSYNKLDSLDGAIPELSQLRELRLKNNRITYVSPGISALTNLEILDLSGNRLTYLPGSISGMQSLRMIDLRSAYITGELKEQLEQLLPRQAEVKFSKDCGCD
ncbi:MAG: hypothetical protein Kow0075_00250 [Salibacteraceae bacterium]